MCDFFNKNPRYSINRASQPLNLTKSTVQKILRKSIRFWPWKYRRAQYLSEASKERRLIFAYHFQGGLEEHLPNIWFSDEAHFYLTGYYNRQNQRYWAKENPYVLMEKPLHSKKITIWAAISSKGITAVAFNETVNSTFYLRLLKEQFIPKLKTLKLLKNSWFMQDEATPHTANDVLEYLNSIFGERVISNKYPEKYDKGVGWSPYSPDLNPCDFFLWGYLKDRVYVNTPSNLEELEATIFEEIQRIPMDMISRVIDSLPRRINDLIQNNGAHFEHKK